MGWIPAFAGMTNQFDRLSRIYVILNKLPFPPTSFPVTEYIGNTQRRNQFDDTTGKNFNGQCRQ